MSFGTSPIISRSPDSSELSLYSRQGETTHVLANELVPGDLVKFTTGDRIPADVRLIETQDLEIDESSLTGETDARKKNPDTCRFENGAVIGEPVPLAERTCIAYMGTLVRNGRGTGVVIATGTDTEFGIIFSMMQDVRMLLAQGKADS